VQFYDTYLAVSDGGEDENEDPNPNDDEDKCGGYEDAEQCGIRGNGCYWDEFVPLPVTDDRVGTPGNLLSCFTYAPQRTCYGHYGQGGDDENMSDPNEAWCCASCNCRDKENDEDDCQNEEGTMQECKEGTDQCVRYAVVGDGSISYHQACDEDIVSGSLCRSIGRSSTPGCQGELQSNNDDEPDTVFSVECSATDFGRTNTAVLEAWIAETPPTASCQIKQSVCYGFGGGDGEDVQQPDYEWCCEFCDCTDLSDATKCRAESSCMAEETDEEEGTEANEEACEILQDLGCCANLILTNAIIDLGVDARNAIFDEAAKCTPAETALQRPCTDGLKNPVVIVKSELTLPADVYIEEQDLIESIASGCGVPSNNILITEWLNRVLQTQGRRLLVGEQTVSFEVVLRGSMAEEDSVGIIKESIVSAAFIEAVATALPNVEVSVSKKR
jgi:hypothetical protein